MTVTELVAKLTELNRPDYIVDARYSWRSCADDGTMLPDCYVDDLFTIDLSGDGYVTLLLGDPS